MIRVIAICVFRHNGRILVSEGVDDSIGGRFARPLGGGVEPGERSADTVRREIREEIAAEVTDLRLLGVMENLFIDHGRPKHEIVFVYDGRLVDASLYRQPTIAMTEAGWDGPAVWQTLDSFGDHCRLVPDGLADLLRDD